MRRFFLIICFLTFSLMAQEGFPVFKYSSGKTVNDNWDASLSSYKYGAIERDTLASREFSPTSWNPAKLLGDKTWNGLLAINAIFDTVAIDTSVTPGDSIYLGRQDSIYCQLQKKLLDTWMNVVDTIVWKNAADTSETFSFFPVDSVVNKTLYYRTNPLSTNTDFPLETHPGSIHRLRVINVDTCYIEIKAECAA